MIAGHVTDDGIPFIMLEVGGQQWRAIIDTGFNGDLELPVTLQALLDNEYVGRAHLHWPPDNGSRKMSTCVRCPFDG